MTVAQLIDILKTLPQDLETFYEDNEFGESLITRARVCEKEHYVRCGLPPKLVILD